MGITARGRGLLTKYPILKNIGVLLSGTVLAQLIAIGTQPIISRLYTDHELGLFSLWMAIPQTIVLVAALRYDMAVVLPDDEADARRLLRTSAALILTVAVLTSLVCTLTARILATKMGHPELAPWLGLTGIYVFGLGMVNLLNFWFTRIEHFRTIAVNRVQMFSTISGVKILAALAGRGGKAGLIGGQLFGQVSAAATMAYKARTALFRPSGSTTPVRTLLARYKKMPLLNAPNALVDGLRLNGIVLCLGLVYSSATVGQFSQAWLLMQAPVTLIAGAISQVFYQRYASAKPGDLTRLVFQSVKISAVAGALPFAILAFAAPVLLPWFLGGQWQLAGLIGQALVIWLYVNVATSPISTVFVVTNRQELLLGFAICYMAFPLALIMLAGPHLAVTTLMWWLSALMSVLLIIMLTLTLWVARRFDASQEASIN